MRSILLLTVTTVVGLALWAALVFIGTLSGWWRESLAPDGNAAAFMEAVKHEVDANYRGSLAFQLIEDGELYDEYFVSVGEPVNRETLFQVASLSKWITAWGVMALVDEGKLDLDTPVSTYLTRWELPDSKFDSDGVTIRRLLSHTAGLTDGLGYAGFHPGTKPQSLEDSLTQAADASPGADGRVRVGVAPGSEWRYSGGGYALLQLIVEEVTGETFASHMQRAVFAPLGMDRSTFVIGEDGTSNLATFYDVDGSEALHYRFAALAPTSLYTSAADMSRFIQAHLEGSRGELPGRGVLKPETLRLMRQPHASQMGADIWGLGTMLYAPNEEDDFVIGHDGNNEPAINTAVRLNPATGDGIVVLETGNKLLATTLAGEWVFWQTGTIDFLTFTLVAEDMITIILVGWGVIVLVAVVVGWRGRRKRPA